MPKWSSLLFLPFTFWSPYNHVSQLRAKLSLYVYILLLLFLWRNLYWCSNISAKLSRWGMESCDCICGGGGRNILVRGESKCNCLLGSCLLGQWLSERDEKNSGKYMSYAHIEEQELRFPRHWRTSGFILSEMQSYYRALGGLETQSKFSNAHQDDE